MNRRTSRAVLTVVYRTVEPNCHERGQKATAGCYAEVRTARAPRLGPMWRRIYQLLRRARMGSVLVIGATGRVGRVVVAELLDAGVAVRALTRRPAAAGLPAGVDVVSGDLTVPESLDAALQGVSAVFLVWTAPPTPAPAVVERLVTQARRVVFLSSPHRTPHP